jgi:AsmA protein
MRRSSRILLWLIAGVFAVLAIAVAVFALRFDPNKAADDFAAEFQEKTGRELVIGGDIDLQIFPWLAVEVGEVRLGNAPGFGDEPFAAIDRARLSVRFWPLIMSREVQVGAAELDGLDLNLEVNARGERNWSDLLEAEDGEEVESPDVSGREAAFEISGVDVRNAAISYVHRPKGDAYSLSDVNISIGRLSSEGGTVPAKGSLRFDVQPVGYSGVIELETQVTFARDDGAVTFGKSSLEGTIEGIAEAPTTLRFATAGIAVDTVEKVTSVQPVEMSILDVDLSAEVEPFSYADTILPKATIRIDAFSPRELMERVGATPPPTADPEALSSVALSAKATMRESSVALTGMSIEFDDTTITGAMTVPFESSGRFIAKFEADAIDLNRYMAPPDEAAAGAGGEASMEIPTDLIKPLNARGEFSIASVRIADLELDNVAATINASGGRLRIHPVSADLYGGKYAGDVSIDASGSVPGLALDESVTGVNLAQLALAMFEQENITGSIEGNFRLSGRGSDMNAIRRSLDGSMSFELADGYYEGTDIWYELRRARALFKQETPPEPKLPPRTKFSSVKASGVVADGVMRNDDFVAELPFMQITGAGKVDLGAGTVDYGLKARVFEKPEALEAVTAEELEDFTKTVIPLKITGPLTSPKVEPDYEALLRDRVEEEVKDKLEDALKDLFKR